MAPARQQRNGLKALLRAHRPVVSSRPSPRGGTDPHPLSKTSNDILADRRFAWARALAQDGDNAAAADLLEQVTALVPAWAPAWVALAEARERDGRPGEAAEAWSRVAALDPGGIWGAEPNLARLDGTTPPTLSDTYIRALFDDYAPRFERHLVDGLGYRGPAVLTATLDRLAPGRAFARALDLGCGTGLMAAALEDRVAAIDGVDLSPAMVERARRTGRYTVLTVGSLDAALAASPAAAYDLITAADVFAYVGGLAPVLGGISRSLAPRGLLAFTVQALSTPHCDAGTHALGPDMRFAHAPDYVVAALEAAGLQLLLIEAASIRAERGEAVAGLVAVASKA